MLTADLLTTSVEVDITLKSRRIIKEVVLRKKIHKTFGIQGERFFIGGKTFRCDDLSQHKSVIVYLASSI